MLSLKYTAEVLAIAAAQSTSVAGVLRHLGVRQSGGSHAHISRQMKRFGIDTSHFKGSAHNRGDRGGLEHATAETSTRLSLQPASHWADGSRLGRNGAWMCTFMLLRGRSPIWQQAHGLGP
jgi:hypothetical protein